jgi:hypothetical protein
MPSAAPFRGEPLRPSSARLWNDNPPIMSGNISDDQRKAIMAEGARLLALEYRQREVSDAQQAAIENDRDTPALKFGGGSEAGSLASSLSRVKAMNARLSGGIPSAPPSLMTATPKQPIIEEQDVSGFKKRKALESKIANELRKVMEGKLGALRTPNQLTKSGWRDDEIDALNEKIDDYFKRNPTYSKNKTLQKRFKNLMTGEPELGKVEDVADEDSDESSASGYKSPADLYGGNPDESTPSRKLPPFKPPPPSSFAPSPLVGRPFINPFAP